MFLKQGFVVSCFTGVNECTAFTHCWGVPSIVMKFLPQHFPKCISTHSFSSACQHVQLVLNKCASHQCYVRDLMGCQRLTGAVIDWPLAWLPAPSNDWSGSTYSLYSGVDPDLQCCTCDSTSCQSSTRGSSSLTWRYMSHELSDKVHMSSGFEGSCSYYRIWIWID